jgi:endoglucanase
MMRGVNLSVAEFGEKALPGVYDKDYAYPTLAEVDYFKSKKMNTLRVPFLWERLQPTLNQAFNATELKYLTDFINAATQKDMKVIVDPHNYARYRGKLIGSSEVPVAAFADFWTRLANTFKNNSRVVFGLVNEPHTMPTEDWLTAANAAAQAIRATGATNLILVPGNSWTGAHSWADNWYGTPNATVMLNFVDPGNNYAFEVHQYFDADNSGTVATCSTTKGSEKLVKFTAWLASNNKKGFLGEFAGANNTTCQQAVQDALTYINNNSNYWIGWTWWAAGPWWGNYMYSIEPPTGGGDAPQMSWLTPYLQ